MNFLLKNTMLAMVALASAAVGSYATLTYGPEPLLRAAKVVSSITGAETEPTNESTAAAIIKSDDGHFWVTAMVNGKAVRMLVDTGATAVALTPADAARLGITPAQIKQGAEVVTAGGTLRASSVRLASVTVAGATLDDVDALIIDKGLDSSLLGMSYLGRLSSFQATRERLILTP